MLFLLSLIMAAMSQAAISFESEHDLSLWNIDNGRLMQNKDHFKDGKMSLGIAWEGGAVVTSGFRDGLEEASASRSGGMNLWVYNEVPADAGMEFVFTDSGGRQVCRLPFHLNFTGWRCVWARFAADMGFDMKKSVISGFELHFPDAAEGGFTCLDLLEFTPKVNWQAMSDAQYHVHRTDFSLVMDFMRYRNAVPDTCCTIEASETDFLRISDRLTDWYLGSGDYGGNSYVRLRKAKEKDFISKGLDRASEVEIRYSDDGTPVGEPLFPMGAPDRIGGKKVLKFRDLNENVLLPLALDYRKNGNRESLEKAVFIYDWFNDQGWADGSAMGTLTFEKLRSAGYFHSFYLLKDSLPEDVRERESASMNWFTIFGMCYDFPPYRGEVADNLRAVALPKLAYALSIADSHDRAVAMTAYKRYMDNALGVAPGYYGTFKSDWSGYHHRGPYNSAYYPHALYVGALVAYILHDTPYALSEETVSNIRNGLLAFRFFCAGPDVPAGTAGRFPAGTAILHELVPAFAYMALCGTSPDMELVAAMKAVLGNDECGAAFEKYVSNVNSRLAYTSTVGEMEAVARALDCAVEPELPLEGGVFMPYSGLMVWRNSDFVFSAKGYSRYIWDFESSASENLYGRYLSYGHLEYTDLRNGNRSFCPKRKEFDWNLISGTTSRILPKSLLEGKGGAFAGHRNFSDMTFLAGVDGSGNASVFSVRLHDINYDTTFRADKSVFFFRDFAVCLGSGISCADREHRTVTTLFQAFDMNGMQMKRGSIVSDGSLVYAVGNGRLDFYSGENGYSRAYIDHGTAPDDEGYEYYIVADGRKRTAEKLLGRSSPVKVIRRDSLAHIVSYGETVSAAVFAADTVFAGMTVSEVNIPLAYVLEKEDDGYLLHFCEPDMRRVRRNHMGELTEADVVVGEEPFRTVMVLEGIFSVSDVTSSRKASGALSAVSPCLPEVRYDGGKTIVAVTTIRGENHTLRLVAR